MSDPGTDPDTQLTGDEDTGDDVVIAHALRSSLLVIALIGVPVAGFLIYQYYGDETAAEVVSEVEGPELRKIDAREIPVIPLVNVTDSSGVDFIHESGRAGEKLLPETMGSGVAVFDFNGDDHLDLLFVNSMRWPWDQRGPSPSPSRLFAGNGNFEFRDVSDESGIDFSVYGMGAAVGDVDNDGDQDLFISAVGQNRFLRNDDGRFVDTTDSAGLGGSEEAWSTSCGFFDYDNDGLLDLFVANYVQWSREADLSQGFTLVGDSRAYGPPRAFSGTFSYLYHNEGDGRFVDVSEQAGIQVLNPNTGVPLGKSLGVAPVDYNADGWIDIAVANDTVGNFLFRNERDGTFTEVGEATNLAYDRSGNARGAMGIDAADFREGTVAIGIGNFANEPSALFMNRRGRNQFIDAAMYTGFGPPTRQALTFGLFFFDPDLDGRLDLFGANGHLEEEIAKVQASQRYRQPPQLFWNAGRDASSELVLAGPEVTSDAFHEPIVGRGAAYGDFDEDGDQDIVISTSGGAPRLFRNDQTTGHRWLRLKLVGSGSNRDAIGAVATLELNDRTISRRVMPTRSYLSQCEKTLTFGLDEGRDDSYKVRVVWPGGQKELYRIEGVNRVATLVEGQGDALKPSG